MTTTTAITVQISYLDRAGRERTEVLSQHAALDIMKTDMNFVLREVGSTRGIFD
jgi:hypothetical protein